MIKQLIDKYSPWLFFLGLLIDLYSIKPLLKDIMGNIILFSLLLIIAGALLPIVVVRIINYLWMDRIRIYEITFPDHSQSINTIKSISKDYKRKVFIRDATPEQIEHYKTQKYMAKLRKEGKLAP